MAELYTIARPYAEAAYRLAKEQSAVDRWEEMLEFSAAVASDAQMKAVIADPNVGADTLERLFLGVCEKALDEQGKNLIRVLIDNHRLALLPVIREAFAALREEQEGVLDARILTAFALDDSQKQSLVAALEKRFGRRINPTVDVDPELIGGVKVEAGDQVFDASVRGQLQNMAYALKR